MECVIMSGVSGSGKSTVAAKLLDQNLGHCVLVSADHYFEVGDQYNFDASKLGAAHAECLRRFLTHMSLGTKMVIVDNTNIDPVEIAPYYTIAEAYHYKTSILTVMCDPEIAAARALHGVDAKLIRIKHNMLMNRKLPRRWVEKREWSQ